MLFEVGIAILVIILSLYLWHKHLDKAREAVASVPGPKPLPIIGNALDLSRDNHEFFHQILGYAEKYGDIFKIMIGPAPFIVISSPEGFEQILRSSKHLSKADEYSYLQPWLHTGLLTSTGDKWRARRKMLTPTFHFKILNDFLTVFNDQSKVMIKRLDSMVGKGEIDTFPYITLCALDIICETAMGKKINAQLSDGESEYVKAVYRMSEIVMNRTRTPWEQNDFFFFRTERGREHNACLKILHGFTRNVIEERDREMKASPEAFKIDLSQDADIGITRKRRLAFLDLLLSMSDESGFTHDDIQEEVDTFMFEGHDTTAAAMNWTVYFIGSHPHVQKKLQEEVDSIFGDSDRDATMDDVRDLKYLENVLKESLRIFPSVPNYARKLYEDTVILGHKIPKGTTVSFLVSALHRNPKIYPDPLKFDPDRFEREEFAQRHPYAYVPFSAGPRNCIGQKFALTEEKVIISYIMRNFDIEATQEWKDLRPEFSLILRPANGIKVKLTRRNKE